MRLGIVTDLKNIQSVADWGYDYIEGTVSSLAKMSEADFENLTALVDKTSIKPEAFCVLLDGSFKVTGPEANFDALRAYLARVLPRVARLGGKVVVFGSGGPRKAPEGFPIPQAVEQFKEALAIAGDEALKHGLTIVLEPLQRGETNVVNNVSEGAEIVKALAHPGVRLLADYFHMGRQLEPASVVEGLAPILSHTHLAWPEDRRPPAHGDGRDWSPFLQSLAKSGYTGRLSIEANWDKFETQAPEALEVLRNAVTSVSTEVA